MTRIGPLLALRVELRLLLGEALVQADRVRVRDFELLVRVEEVIGFALHGASRFRGRDPC